MRKPRVLTRCVANNYAAPGQRIVEYSFPNGKGGLISFDLDNEGNARVDLYQQDPEVTIRVGGVAA